LQARRQRTVALQLPLKAGGEISAALRQPGRKIGIILRIAAADDTAIGVAKSLGVAAIIITVIAAIAIVILVVVIVIAIGAAIGRLIVIMVVGLNLASRGRRLRSCNCDSGDGHKRQDGFGFNFRILLSGRRRDGGSRGCASASSYQGSLTASKDCAQDRACGSGAANFLDVGLSIRVYCFFQLFKLFMR